MPKTLVLIPTRLEEQSIRSHLVNLGEVVVERCGFGPVAASATTAHYVAKHCPARVVLVGVAGSVGGRLAIGSAAQFSSVACFGIGAGWADQHTPASALGWDQLCVNDERVIGDSIILDTSLSGEAGLVTVCAASTEPADVRRYQQLYPQTIAEDMEGFGVAIACQLSRTPLAIIRGISNAAGDRNKANWKMDAALEAATAMTLEYLHGDFRDARP